MHIPCACCSYALQRSPSTSASGAPRATRSRMSRSARSRLLISARGESRLPRPSGPPTSSGIMNLHDSIRALQRICFSGLRHRVGSRILSEGDPMSAPIRSVAVLGAGVMGSGIAAHLANAGIPTLLLDIVPPNLGPEERTQPAARNRFAAGGLEKALKAKPAAFFHASRARLVTVGNLEDDLGKLAGVDLVLEAVLERLDVKQELFARLEKVIGEGTIVASNTSGLPIARMTEGRSAAFKKNFVVTHFFNPPRYMKLLELVAGPDTDPAVFARARRFGEDL